MALRRLIARRGQPLVIYSNNATSFIGARAELQRAWVEIASKATLNARAPKEEVVYTIPLEAEKIVNSRPMTHVSVDATDLVAFTPNHFLLGSASGQPPLGRFDDADLSRREHTNAAWEGRLDKSGGREDKQWGAAATDHLCDCPASRQGGFPGG
ncbi:hypothetical protein EVAR_62797_1 [Eumeta japonica]|uniref:Uncharacterized protein n=1 Tax=Eumeta variegata TaxID=151549 RepID=A0A4C1ZIH7_EUMVA|nr:hypothetical protein EVAR_62797_1 [Eumeta japonica]